MLKFRILRWKDICFPRDPKNTILASHSQNGPHEDHAGLGGGEPLVTEGVRLEVGGWKGLLD